MLTTLFERDEGANANDPPMSSADTASVIRRNMMGIELLLLPDAWVSVISCGEISE